MTLVMHEVQVGVRLKFGRLARPNSSSGLGQHLFCVGGSLVENTNAFKFLLKLLFVIECLGWFYFFLQQPPVFLCLEMEVGGSNEVEGCVCKALIGGLSLVFPVVSSLSPWSKYRTPSTSCCSTPVSLRGGGCCVCLCESILFFIFTHYLKASRHGTCAIDKRRLWHTNGGKSCV